MRMRAVLAALTVMALGAAACGEPGTAGESAEAATSVDPRPPRYNVSLVVDYLDDSYRPIAVSLKTWGFELDYQIEATLEEGGVVELDPPATIHWWIKCHDSDWDLIPHLSWDIEEPATWPESGPIVSLQVHDDEVWLVHRLPSRAGVAEPKESCEESIASDFPLGWGGIGMRQTARTLDWTAGAEPGHYSYGEPEGRPDYIETGDEHSGFVIWALPIADLGIEAHEVDYSFGVNHELHTWNLTVTGTISRASN